MKIISIKEAEFLEGLTREGKKIERSSPEEESTSNRWSQSSLDPIFNTQLKYPKTQICFIEKVPTQEI